MSPKLILILVIIVNVSLTQRVFPDSPDVIWEYYRGNFDGANIEEITSPQYDIAFRDAMPCPPKPAPCLAGGKLYLQSDNLGEGPCVGTNPNMCNADAPPDFSLKNSSFQLALEFETPKKLSKFLIFIASGNGYDIDDCPHEIEVAYSKYNDPIEYESEIEIPFEKMSRYMGAQMDPPSGLYNLTIIDDLMDSIVTEVFVQINFGGEPNLPPKCDKSPSIDEIEIIETSFTFPPTNMPTYETETPTKETLNPSSYVILRYIM